MLIYSDFIPEQFKEKRDVQKEKTIMETKKFVLNIYINTTLDRIGKGLQLFMQQFLIMPQTDGYTDGGSAR